VAPEADRPMACPIGPTGTAIVMRLTCFMLLCIGIEVPSAGVAELRPEFP
jgi:small neutral amino acid transporter SnatA (MarC family)